MRFSIRALMAFCVVTGIFFAGFHYATRLWMQVIVFSTLMTICLATILAKFGPTNAKAYWGSFAFVGMVYFVTALQLGFLGEVPTTTLFNYLCRKSESLK